MKKYLKYLLLTLIVFIPLCLCGCKKGEDNNSNGDNASGGNQTETTYDVNIFLNNPEFGRVTIDNIKEKYNIGEVINVTVAPNNGYYLRGYSDHTSKSLTRQIVVNGNMNVTVNLSKGEACSFYGYYIAFENEVDERTMLSYEGNTGTYLKHRPNTTLTRGKLRLEYSKMNTNACWAFKHSTTNEVNVFASTSSSTTITENDLVSAFGSENKNEWIDITECFDYVGSAYVVTEVGQGKDDACFVNSGVFDLEKFSESEIAYLYNGEELTYGGFTKVSDTNYSHSLEGSKTKFIQTFRIFNVFGKNYYWTNPSVEYMVTQGEVRNYKITLNEIEYTLSFDYSN